MKLSRLFAFMAILLISTPVHASTQASKDKTPLGYSFLMCDSNANTGAVCDDADGEDVYAIVDRFTSLTFIFSESGSGATCEAYAAGQREPALVPDTADLSTISTDSLFSTSLSITQSKITLQNVNFKYVWVTCTDATAMGVIVELRGTEPEL
jgi:hypothetical protein